MLTQPHTNAHWALHNVRDTTPALMFVQEQQPSIPRYDGTEPGKSMYVRYVYENTLAARPGPNFYNCENHYECALAVYNPSLMRQDPYGVSHRWIEVASGGPKNVSWKASYDAEWLKVKPDHGHIAGDGSADSRVYVSIDWSKVPEPTGDNHTHHDNTTIIFSASDGSNTTFNVPISKPRAPPSDFKGFVQGDGYVVMEAAHFNRNSTAEGYSWEDIEYYGKSLSGVSMFPSTDVNFTSSNGPSLEYDIWTTGTGQETVEVTVQIGPAFNFQLGSELMLGVSFDGEQRDVAPIPPYAEGGETVPLDWDEVVRNEIRNVTMTFDLGNPDQPGKHTVGLHGVTSGVVVERVWVDLGGIAARGYSYYGPPESKRV